MPAWIDMSRVDSGSSRVLDLLETAGFTVTEVAVFYEEGAPKAPAADSLGVAVAS